MPEHVGEGGEHVHDVGHHDRGRDSREILPQRTIRQEDDAAADACGRAQVLRQPQQDHRRAAAGGLVPDEDHVRPASPRHPGGWNRGMPEPLADAGPLPAERKLNLFGEPLEPGDPAHEFSDCSTEFHKAPATLPENCRKTTTARNLLSRPPHRKRSERGSVPGSEGVWGERGVEKQ